MATINYLTRIEFDDGALSRLGAVLKDVGIQRPLIVTDRGLFGSPLFAELLSALNGIEHTVFADTPQNPTETAVDLAAGVFKDHGCDGVIAFGGGSSMDLAKGVALRATHSEPLAFYAAINGGVAKISSAVAPVIAIPTTAGTGSEVGRAALITLKTGSKLGLISPYLIPKVAICDPLLTLGLPASLTAATGMDAFTHCLETFISPLVNPPAEAIAIDGLERINRWIQIAVTDGPNKEARWHMMMGALQGGLTFQKGLGAVHAMSHPLGALQDVTLHHGTLNALLLPIVYETNQDAIPQWKQTKIRTALGIEPNASVADYIRQLNASLNLPASLGAMGVTAKHLPALVQGAVKDHSNGTNPKPLNEADYVRLFNAML
ncbi:MAG: iron-containing alcohol dehydrogenase [Orrella sp.]